MLNGAYLGYMEGFEGRERGLAGQAGRPILQCKLTPVLDIPHAAGAFASAFLAGAINSVAGGGTLVSFPTLIWLGLGSVTANATSTVAIWPGRWAARGDTAAKCRRWNHDSGS